MAIYIRDHETEALVRALACKQKLSLNDAVKDAVRDKLRTLKAAPSLHDRLSEIIRDIALAPKRGKKADKKFFNAL